MENNLFIPYDVVLDLSDDPVIMKVLLYLLPISDDLGVSNVSPRKIASATGLTYAKVRYLLSKENKYFSTQVLAQSLTQITIYNIDSYKRPQRSSSRSSSRRPSGTKTVVNKVLERNRQLLSTLNINDHDYGGFINWISSDETMHKLIFERMEMISLELFNELKEKYGLREMVSMVATMINNPKKIKDYVYFGTTLKNWLIIKNGE